MKPDAIKVYPTLLNRSAMARAGMFFTDPGAVTPPVVTPSATPPVNPDDDDPDDVKTPPTDVAGLNKTLERISAERRAARKEAREARDRLATLEAERAAADAAARAEADRVAAEQGQFKDLAERRGTELATTKSELTAVTAERDRLLAAVNANVNAEWDALPQDVRDVFPGDMTDPLARLEVLPRAKALAEKLNGKPANPGNGPNPPVGGGTAPTTETTIEEMRRARGLVRR